jgi:hypothetical protein
MTTGAGPNWDSNATGSCLTTLAGEPYTQMSV